MSQSEQAVGKRKGQSKEWAFAGATFFVGDVLTTAYGLTLPGVVEGNPAAQEILSTGGIAGMLVAKGAVLGAAYMGNKLVEDEYKHYVPGALGIMGAFITAHNFRIITEAKFG